MEQLLGNIIAYLDYLNTDRGLCVTVHFSEAQVRKFPEFVFARLLPYNVHTNAYCALVKRSHLSQCLGTQAAILATDSCNGYFCHTCHGGVREFVHHIRHNDSAVGYVAVSGYRNAVPSPLCPDCDSWQHHLSSDPVPETLCSILIPPLCRMLEILLTYPMDNTPDGEHNLILHFISEQQGQITLDELCARFGRSRSYISHAFKAKCGMTLRSYCNERKLEQANRLIKHTSLPITEVAQEAGFHDISYFIALFRKKYGATPLQYRKQGQ